MPPQPSVVPLAIDRLDEVIDVFTDAFQDYPVMRVTVGDEGDVAARVRRLVRLFVTRRTRRGGPMYGVRRSKGSQTGQASELAGAILLTRPIEPEPPPDVAKMSEDAWRELGEQARLRYDAYAAASNFFFAMPPHLHLNMIGVRRTDKGRGLGRVLLDAVRRIAEEDPDSAGVSLTTENPRNVELYQHFGYEVAGHAPVIVDPEQGRPAYETWGMFLRIR